MIASPNIQSYKNEHHLVDLYIHLPHMRLNCQLYCETCTRNFFVIPIGLFSVFDVKRRQDSRTLHEFTVLLVRRRKWRQLMRIIMLFRIPTEKYLFLKLSKIHIFLPKQYRYIFIKTLMPLHPQGKFYIPHI